MPLKDNSITRDKDTIGLINIHIIMQLISYCSIPDAEAKVRERAIWRRSLGGSSDRGDGWYVPPRSVTKVCHPEEVTSKAQKMRG